MSNRTIVVAGASGFVAYHVVEALIANGGTRVLAFDLRPDRSQELPGVEWTQGDVRDFEAVRALVARADGVVNLAGVSRLGDGFALPYECMVANAIGALNILEAARSSPARPWVVLGSTREVQDVRFPTDHVFFQNARGVYGLSKLFTELLGERYACDYGLRALTLRLSDVYGSLRDNFDRVLPRFVWQALADEDLRVTNSPDGRDFTYYLDTVAGVLKGIEFAAKLTAGRYEVATLCTGRSTALVDLATLIVKLTGSRSRTLVVPETAADSVRNSPLQNNTERARALLDFRALTSLEEGIALTAATYRANIGRYRGASRVV